MKNAYRIVDGVVHLQCGVKCDIQQRTAMFDEEDLPDLQSIEGYWLVSGGYVQGRDDDGTKILAHRLIFQSDSDDEFDAEVVHHINENTLDNRKCNLEVLSRSEHATHHHYGEHLKEIDEPDDSRSYDWYENAVAVCESRIVTGENGKTRLPA